MGSRVHASAALMLVAVASSASAVPTIESTRFFTDRWQASASFPGLAGDYLQLFAVVRSPDAPELVSAVATQGPRTRELNFFTGPIFEEKNFQAYFLNTALTGPWDLEVTDSSGTATGVFNAIADPQFLPFLNNVQILGNGLSPTLTWELPDLSGFDVDAIRVRTVIAATGEQVFESDLLAPTTTSFAFTSVTMSRGVEYQFRLLLDDFESGSLENRSNTFSPLYRAVVPEPSTVALMLGGLGLIGCFARRKQHLREATERTV